MLRHKLNWVYDDSLRKEESVSVLSYKRYFGDVIDYNRGKLNHLPFHVIYLIIIHKINLGLDAHCEWLHSDNSRVHLQIVENWVKTEQSVLSVPEMIRSVN